MTNQPLVKVLTETEYPWPISSRQSLVLGRISRCRTAAMGGKIAKCNMCDAKDRMYYSCRDRHCPQCQSLAKEKWLEDRESDLLPVNYYHVVFTIPHELNPCGKPLRHLVQTKRGSTVKWE